MRKIDLHASNGPNLPASRRNGAGWYQEATLSEQTRSGLVQLVQATKRRLETATSPSPTSPPPPPGTQPPQQPSQQAKR